MRARDVRDKLKNENVPPMLMVVLCEIAEDQMAEREQIMQLADMLDRVMHNMTAMMVVAGNMKDKIDGDEKTARERMKAIQGDENGNG